MGKISHEVSSIRSLARPNIRIVMFGKRSIVRYRDTALLAEGLSKKLSEIVGASYGYESSVIVPFLIRIKSVKSVEEAQEILNELVSEIWDIPPNSNDTFLVESLKRLIDALNDLAQRRGMGEIAAAGSVKLLLDDSRLSELKKLADELVSKIKELVEPPFTPEKSRYLSLITTVERDDDYVVPVE